MQHHNLEDSDLNLSHHRNLKSCCILPHQVNYIYLLDNHNIRISVIQECKAQHAKTQKESERTAGAEDVTPGWLFILLFEDDLLLYYLLRCCGVN
jgi:hypothetical protein